MACLSTAVTPKVQRLVGVTSLTIPINTASSVNVNCLAGSVSVQLGSDPAIQLPAGASVGWGVESCSQKLAAAVVVINDSASDDCIVSYTL